MSFPLPLPACCSGSGKRKWEAAERGCPVLDEFGLSEIAALLGRGGAEPRSATGEAVTICGFDDDTGGGHGGEAFVKCRGADAAGRP
jgi:hypothetical protein